VTPSRLGLIFAAVAVAAVLAGILTAFLITRL
jgi:hypothetical protein